jgi:hypothetical protein
MESYPRLDIIYNQVVYKTPDYGSLLGLPKNENNKTRKTEANALALHDYLINIPTNHEDVLFYENGSYQRGTRRGCDSINVYDPITNVVAVYQKQPDGTNLFLTVCKLTVKESTHLIAIKGDFVTEKVLNEQKAVSTNIQNNTTKNDGL